MTAFEQFREIIILYNLPESKSVKGLLNTLQDDAEGLEFLNCLRAAGVDNWEGFSEAQEMMNEWED